MSELSTDKLQLNTLPKELLLEVCSYLSISDLKNLALTSKE